MKKAFTLIELLVVVLIIGILTAIVLPQYQKIVEKSRMAEAIIIVNAIVKAQHVFYLTNGRYAEHNELSSLDIDIFGKKTKNNRIQSQYFEYSTGGISGSNIAKANRFPKDKTYYLSVTKTSPTRVHCYHYANASAVQIKLCTKLNETGSL